MPSCRVYGLPASKGSLRCLGRGRHIESARGLPAWMLAVKDAWREQVHDHWADRDAMYSVRLTFLLPWPASYGRPPLAALEHRRRPDLDKLTRGVLDALTGYAWIDDAQVCSIDARKFYAYDGQPPGCRIEVITMQRSHPRT